MAIGEILKEQRGKKQLTQEQVAKEIFVSQKTISNWEASRTLPDIESIIRLARLYSMSLDDLLLEGSDIVEEIKKRETIRTLNQVYLLGPMLTGIFLLLLMYLPSGWSDLWRVGLIALGAVSNSITVYYFQFNLSLLKGQGTRREHWSAKVVAILMVVFASLFGWYLWQL